MLALKIARAHEHAKVGNIFREYSLHEERNLFFLADNIQQVDTDSSSVPEATWEGMRGALLLLAGQLPPRLFRFHLMGLWPQVFGRPLKIQS